MPHTPAPDGAVELPCRAVLFDCDGVLVASTGTAERAWRQWAREHDLDEQTVLDGLHGRRSRDTVAALLPPEQREAGVARIDGIEIDAADETEAVPGVADLLAALGDTPWAVVTSAAAPLLEARLRAAGLPLPAHAVTSADVTSGKPDPEGYLRGARLLGVPVEECVVVEDSPAGIAAGRAAGAGAVLGVGAMAVATDADPVVTDLRGVTWTGRGLRVDPAALLHRAA